MIDFIEFLLRQEETTCEDIWKYGKQLDYLATVFGNQRFSFFI